MKKTIALNIDCKKEMGIIKPMHCINNIPNVHADSPLIKECNIPYTRLHDTGGAYGGGVYVDVPVIFRNFNADENDPASYDFAFTDDLLKHIEASGMTPYYRLGVTIENHCRIKAYNIYPPVDFNKWARICEHILAHYTEGWADGFFYKIEYAEIWNEPENNILDPMNNPCWRGTKEQFFEMYKIAARHLKNRFPNIKIGGYGSSGFYSAIGKNANPWANVKGRYDNFVIFFTDFLQYISDKETYAPLDFFSWHSYGSVDDNIQFAEFCRKTLDKYGFNKTESHLNEWNPGIMQRGLLKDASDICANMIELQKSSTDMAMYYAAETRMTYCGLFDPLGNPHYAYYVFRAFGELYGGIQTACQGQENGIYALAAVKDGKNYILVTNNTSRKKSVKLNVTAKRARVIGKKIAFKEKEFNGYIGAYEVWLIEF